MVGGLVRFERRDEVAHGPDALAVDLVDDVVLRPAISGVEARGQDPDAGDDLAAPGVLLAARLVPVLLEAVLLADMLAISISQRKGDLFWFRELKALQALRKPALLMAECGLEKPVQWGDIIGQLAENLSTDQIFGGRARAVVETFDTMEKSRTVLLLRLSDLESSV